METRKIQVTGKSTYIISLPKAWISKFGVKSGDSVGVIPLGDGTILINPNLGKRLHDMKKKYTINVGSNNREEVFRRFIAVYLAGYDKIEIRHNGKPNSEFAEMVTSLKNSVMGLETIDETSNSITLQDFLDSSDFSLSQGVRRMYLITRNMFQNSIDNLVKPDSGAENNSKNDTAMKACLYPDLRDDEVDRLYWLICKQYNQMLFDVYFVEKMHMTQREALSFLLAARCIERIADHSVKIIKSLNDIDESLPIMNKIRDVAKSAMDIYDNSIETLYKCTFEKSNEVIVGADVLSDSIVNLKHEIASLKKKPILIVSLTYIIDSIDRIVSYGKDIAEISIDHLYVIGSSK